MFEFDDERLKELLFLYRAKHYPDSLNNEEVKKWRSYMANALTLPNIASSQTIESALKECEELMLEHPELEVLKEVKLYLNEQQVQLEEIKRDVV